MEQTHDTQWERSLEQVARRFDYPPTPAIADNLRGRMMTADDRRPTAAYPSGGGRPSAVGRRLAWALLLVAFVAALLAAPPTRAAILAFFARVGAIDVFLDETAPTAAPSTPAPLTPRPATPSAPTGAGAVAHSLSLLDLGQPTTLAEAEQWLGFAPQLPAALGEPDEVYRHRVDLPAVTYVWRGPEGAPLSLTQIGVAEFARKMIAEGNVEETTVNDAPAVWLTGPHALQLLGDRSPDARPPGALLITSNVLIWVWDGFTFRLEGDLTLPEAVAIAESVAPAPTPTGD